MASTPFKFLTRIVKSMIKSVLFLFALLLVFPTLPKQAGAQGAVDDPNTPKSQLQAGDKEEPATPKPADAKLLACPAAGAAIELSSGDWYLGGDCTASGLSLHGDAQLWVEGHALTVGGNVSLDQKAELHILGGSFNQANRVVFEYYIHAKDNSVLELRDVKVATNAGVAGNLTSSYEGSGDSLLRVENVQINQLTSWLLCSLRDRARLEAKDSDNFPNEVYPKDSSTARIEGPLTTRRIWLYFLPGSAGTLANLPATRPFSFSFGRNTPGVTGIGYQVDVVNGNVDFGIQSYPHSNVKISNVSGDFGLDCQFSDVTSPESLTGLKGGRQSGTYCGDDRVLVLENVQAPPYGWQLYSHNDNIPPASVIPVTVTDSLVNELGAFKQGRFEISHVQFAFAVIAAVGPSSRIHIRDSVINSQSVISNSDGEIKIEDSKIYGALIQAVSHSRILLLNSALLTNERNPDCVPVLPPMPASLPNACNPFNPAREVQLVVRDQGAVVVASIDPVAAPVRQGDKYTFVGDAIYKTTADTAFTYDLGYRSASASEFTKIATGAASPKREVPLSQLDTTGLAPGDYVVELQLIVPGQDPVTVQRPFTITAP
jgi:hypothetical protein